MKISEQCDYWYDTDDEYDDNNHDDGGDDDDWDDNDGDDDDDDDDDWWWYSMEIISAVTIHHLSYYSMSIDGIYNKRLF